MAHLYNYSYTEHSPVVICSTHVLYNYVVLYTDITYTQTYMCTGTCMEAERCGVRGVTRVAHIDIRNTSVNCPTPLTQYALDSGERVMCLLKQLSTELLEVFVH